MQPYFCGQHRFCAEFNSTKALALAKENLDRYYTVVGILEYHDLSLKILEKMLPRYFKGLVDLKLGTSKFYAYTKPYIELANENETLKLR